MRIKAQDHTLNIDLSEAFLHFCSGGDCIHGTGSLTNSLEFAKNSGITDEAFFPYQGHEMPCENRLSGWENHLSKIRTYASHMSMSSRKNAIAGFGPVVGGMAVYSDLFSYTGGVYTKTSGSDFSGYTGVCVIGYDDINQCWIIKKSWGTGWGENGFCRVAYGQADLLIDTDIPFYSVDPDIEPLKGSGIAKYVLVDKHIDVNAVLLIYAGGRWRNKIISDIELAGIAQEMFTASRVDVWWDNKKITRVRPWKTI